MAHLIMLWRWLTARLPASTAIGRFAAGVVAFAKTKAMQPGNDGVLADGYTFEDDTVGAKPDGISAGGKCRDQGLLHVGLPAPCRDHGRLYTTAAQSRRRA